MRKKSHISLAAYLADKVGSEGLSSHRKAFCIGSILPDCKPSFLTTRHAFNETFEMLQKRVEKYMEYSLKRDGDTMKSARDLGQIIHYTADYFTFPHNRHYDGTLKDHCIYEKSLLVHLKDYLTQFDASKKRELQIHFDSVEILFEFIKEKHREYMARKRSVEEDCRYIVAVNYQITQGIIQLLEEKRRGIACMVQ